MITQLLSVDYQRYSHLEKRDIKSYAIGYGCNGVFAIIFTINENELDL